MGNWDVRKTSKTADGIAFETPETNTGKPFQMDLAKIRKGWLRIKTRSPDAADELEYEKCSPHNQ